MVEGHDREGHRASAPHQRRQCTITASRRPLTFIPRNGLSGGTSVLVHSNSVHGSRARRPCGFGTLRHRDPEVITVVRSFHRSTIDTQTEIRTGGGMAAISAQRAPASSSLTSIHPYLTYLTLPSIGRYDTALPTLPPYSRTTGIDRRHDRGRRRRLPAAAASHWTLERLSSPGCLALNLITSLLGLARRAYAAAERKQLVLEPSRVKLVDILPR